MKNKIVVVIICTIFISLLFFSCDSSSKHSYDRAVEVYDLWVTLQLTKSVTDAEIFFNAINEYDLKIFNSYPELKQEAQSRQILMNQKKQELVDLLKIYEESATPELELQINKVIGQINVLMIRYIQSRNYIVEDALHRYTTFYILLIVVIIVAVSILIFLNERELKKKDERISQSEIILKHTMEVQEAERSRISRELHDTVAQSMKYVSIMAEKISDKELAEKTITAQNDNIEDIRKMCYNLMPPSFKNMSIVDTLNILADKIFDKDQTQVRIVTNGNIDFSSYTDEQFINIYRIIQELFQNIAKHAKASEVTVLFRKEERLKIIISDDGIGMDENLVSDINLKTVALYQNLHFGIKNTLERIQLLNGTIEFRSVEDCGTTIVIEV